MPAPAQASLDSDIGRAEAFVRRGNWHAALSSYRSILEGVSRLPLRREAFLLAMDRFADIAATVGYTSAAGEMLSALAMLRDAAGDSYGRDYAYTKQAYLEASRGNLSEAKNALDGMTSTLGDVTTIEFSERGIRQWEERVSWPQTDQQDRAVLFAQLYLAMGALLASLGCYGNALNVLNRGLAFTGKGSPVLAQRAAPHLHAAIAAALLEKGEILQAAQEMEDRIGYADKKANPALFVRVRETSAKLHILQGAFGSAQDELKQVASLCSELQFAAAECTARLNLAQVFIFLNKTAEAGGNIDRAVAIARNLGDANLLERALALSAAERARLSSFAEGVSIAGSVAQSWQGAAADQDKPGRSLPENLDIPQAANYLAFFEDRLLGAHWQLGLGRVANARILLGDMRRTFGTSDSRLIALRLEAFEALLLYYEQNYEAAAAILRKLVPLYQELALKPELWQLQRLLGWCLARTHAPQGDQDALALISETLLEDITSTLEPEDQAIYSLNKWTTGEEYLATEIDALIAAQKSAQSSSLLVRPYRLLQVARRVQALAQRIDRFKEELLNRDAKSSTMRARSLRGFIGEQLALRRHEASLKFLVLPDRVLLIQRTRFRVRFGVSPISRLTLRALIKEWHEWTSGLRTGGDFLAESAQSARHLDTALQLTTALALLPRRVTSLRIAPDDCLHGFPFAVLKFQNKYLVEKFALSIQHSDYETPAASSARRSASALFASVTAAATNFPALSMANEEAAPFLNWARKAVPVVLSNETATREKIAATLAHCAFAHIACHGAYLPNNPEQTGLVLAPRPPEYEILSITDVARLRLDRLKHLTLSSCWSADSFTLPGRWVVSFPQRFRLAGAETVLGCLWEVEEGFASQFFARYYQHLAKFTPSEALALTQRACLSGALGDSQNVSWSDPIYWSGYRIYGGTRKVF